MSKKTKNNTKLKEYQRCGQDEFHCDNDCKPRYLVCDGRRDCMDGLDEFNCNYTTTAPTPKQPYPCPELTCPDGKCFRYAEKCDNTPDCDDQSDEHNCKYF